MTISQKTKNKKLQNPSVDRTQVWPFGLAVTPGQTPGDIKALNMGTKSLKVDGPT